MWHDAHPVFIGTYLVPVNWTRLADWWRRELASDPTYDEVVTPLLLDLLDPRPGHHYLDLGCGDGRVMRTVARHGARVHGLDLNLDLVRMAGVVAVARLPWIPIDDDVYDGTYSVLTLEHISDHGRFFVEAARVTKQAGVMVVVMNHPIWTAPESTPITDSDGEVLWRPGRYFSTGQTELPAGGSSIIFHHRTVADLLSSAADGGWRLERMVELPHHEVEDQMGIPRLLGCRWSLTTDR